MGWGGRGVRGGGGGAGERRAACEPGRNQSEPKPRRRGFVPSPPVVFFCCYDITNHGVKSEMFTTCLPSHGFLPPQFQQCTRATMRHIAGPGTGNESIPATYFVPRACSHERANTCVHRKLKLTTDNLSVRCTPDRTASNDGYPHQKHFKLLDTRHLLNQHPQNSRKQFAGISEF